MSFNTKQSTFIAKMQEVATKLQRLYGECFNIYESFQEEFQNSQSNNLNDPDLVDELAAKGFNYTNIAEFCNQAALNYINYYTSSSVTTREFGKDIRKISNT